MKAYLVHNGESMNGEDYGAALIFASSGTLAKSLAARKLDTEYPDLRVNRWPSADNPYVEERREATRMEYREAEFHEDLDEPTCSTCGKSSWGFDEYAVCDECHQCRECGCCDDCALSHNA